MAFSRPDDWVWDFWLADTGREYHLFFLTAPRHHTPDDRHRAATIGHAVSTDLRTWIDLGLALGPSVEPAFDDLATWTGSVVQDDAGRWHLFYTGLSRAEDGMVQRIGVATSSDLTTWVKAGPDALVAADSRWYHRWSPGSDAEAWRDPWVLRDPDGNGWHMLVTATAVDAEPGDGGVLGHAWSADLMTWEVRPPLTEPGSGFSQLEVPQVCVVDGRPVLVFNCLGGQLSPSRRAAGVRGGVWAVPAPTVLGPFDIAHAGALTDESLYVGKLAQSRDGEWALLAFVNEGPGGDFVGTITDPIPVTVGPAGLPSLAVVRTPTTSP
jgi:beta-fructofuranosidase